MPPLNELFSVADTVLLTDELGAPADFLIHQTLVSHFKNTNRPDARCAFISVAGDLVRWRTLCLKSGVNLDSKIKDRLFVFIDASAISPNPPGALLELFTKLKLEIEDVFAEDGPNLLIVDDLSTLEWIGFPAPELSRFARALSAICMTQRASLVFRQHIAVKDEPDDVFSILLQLSSYHVEVRSLSSGRSGSVSGEIAVHPCPRLSGKPVLHIPRQQALQYRLADTSVVYFEKGTDSAVL